MEQPSVAFEDKDKKKIGRIIDQVNDIEISITRILTKLPFVENVKRFINEKTFGTFDQLRAELLLRYDA